ncbi:MAG: DinB family protein [Anaerolineales bacterium]|nr:DinB family protein [Anaerolineales bacterium]
MLDFEVLAEDISKLGELTENLTVTDLREFTNEMVDMMLAHLRGVTDTDVVFVPADPAADDPYAAAKEDAYQAWTLGHVIVHATASAEESAFLAAELARGVVYHGRSRYETAWQTITTVEQCRRRLEESRRMRLMSLELWPDEPHLENCYTPWAAVGPINAVGRFVLGLRHDYDHLGQIEDCVRQAKIARDSGAGLTRKRAGDFPLRIL